MYITAMISGMKQTTLRSWGNSQGVTLPKQLLEMEDLHVGTRFTIRVNDGTIILIPERNQGEQQTVTLTELFSDWEGPYQAPEDLEVVGNEWETGRPSGRELW